MYMVVLDEYMYVCVRVELKMCDDTITVGVQVYEELKSPVLTASVVQCICSAFVRNEKSH